MKRHKVKNKGKCLLKGKVHAERRMGLAQRESPTFGKCQFFLKVQFSRSLSPLGPVTFFCPLWLICLRPLPWGVNAHPNQAVSRSEGFCQAGNWQSEQGGPCGPLYYLKIVDSFYHVYVYLWGFPGGSVVKNLPLNAGDAGDIGLIPGLGRSPGGGNGNLLPYSC